MFRSLTRIVLVVFALTALGDFLHVTLSHEETSRERSVLNEAAFVTPTAQCAYCSLRARFSPKRESWGVPTVQVTLPTPEKQKTFPELSALHFEYSEERYRLAPKNSPPCA